MNFSLRDALRWHGRGLRAGDRRRPRPLRPELEACERRRLLALVTYHGGPLIPHVEVETVYYGQAWAADPQLQQQANLLDGFFSWVTSSSYMNLLSEYSINSYAIGKGSFVGRELVTGAGSPASGSTVDDTAIQAMLGTEIAAGRLQPPDANRVLFVFTPPNVVVTDSGENSLNNFLGYHSDFIDRAGTDVAYAVIPHPVGNGPLLPGLTAFQQQTEVSSHELAESITDPTTPGGWYENDNSDEIADICNQMDVYLDDYVVQQLYSNARGTCVMPAGATANDPPDLSATGKVVGPLEGSAAPAVVATFRDSATFSVASDFSATISWGDGTTSSGTVAVDPATPGLYDVSGGHNYGSKGGSTFNIGVTITDLINTATVSALGSAHVADALLTASGTSIVTNQGVPFAGTVATFSDADTGGTPGNYSATIAWGDGATAPGTVAVGSAGGFVVGGTHTYTSQGASIPVTVTINDKGGATTQASSTAKVTDQPLQAKGQTIAATEGAVFSGPVATFADADSSGAVGSFSATIAWGDGATSTGTVAADPLGGFDVFGTHAYAEQGSDALNVFVNDVGGASASAAGTANVADVAVSATGGLTLSATEGSSFAGLVVASFTDPGGAEASSAYSASISWGDGTTSAGAIAVNQGAFQVSGGHTYAEEGIDSIVVTIAHLAAPTASATSSAVVSDAALSASGRSIATQEGMAFSGLVASFHDADPAGVASQYSATISWGDATTSSGTVSGSASGFSVRGVHTYSSVGTSTIRVTILDAGGSSATATGSAVAGASVPFDFDGVGMSELGVFRPSTAEWLIAGHSQPIPFGAPNLFDIPVPGDYDGVGRSELAVFRPSTGQWIISNPNDGSQRIVSFGAPNLFDIPVPGNYDGTGRTEPAVFRPSTGQWIILNPATGTQRIVGFGAPNLFDIPVPGDYDGVGRTEMAVFRPSTAQWIILDPVDGSQRIVGFGAPNLFDIPVPGDYDGVGRAELAVFRPSTTQWIIDNPVDGSQRIVNYGAPNLFDLPLEAPIGSLVKLGIVGGSGIQAQGVSQESGGMLRSSSRVPASSPNDAIAPVPDADPASVDPVVALGRVSPRKTHSYHDHYL